MNEHITELLEDLKQYTRILVTGPQRSGTTITAQMLAAELKYRYIDEHDFTEDGHVWPDDLNKALSGEPTWTISNGIVIQSPSISYWVHNLKEYDNLAVVFCVRSLEEIYNSQARWQWLLSPDYVRMTEKYKAMPEFRDLINMDANPAKMAYMAWYNYQQYQLDGIAFEFWYDWLKDSGYFVPLEERQVWKGWGFKSTEPLLPPMKPKEGRP